MKGSGIHLVTSTSCSRQKDTTSKPECFALADSQFHRSLRHSYNADWSLVHVPVSRGLAHRFCARYYLLGAITCFFSTTFMLPGAPVSKHHVVNLCRSWRHLQPEEALCCGDRGRHNTDFALTLSESVAFT
jgi:hypothetical protein